MRAAGTPIVVRKLKFDGSVKYEWPGAQLPSPDPAWTVALHDYRRHRKRQEPEPPPPTGYDIHFLCSTEPVSVLFNFDASGEWIEAKCDAAFPATVHHEFADFIDLDLDVIVLPDFSHYVRDQDVFAERRLSMNYTGEAVRTAHLGILHALRLVRRNAFPFDGHPQAMVRSALATGRWS